MGTLSLVISNVRGESLQTVGAEQRHSMYLEEKVTLFMWQVPVKATSIPWDQCQSGKNNPNLDFAHAIRSPLLTIIFLLLQNDPSTGYPQNKPRKKVQMCWWYLLQIYHGVENSQHWIKVLVILISAKQISTKPPWLGPCSYGCQHGSDTWFSCTD